MSPRPTRREFDVLPDREGLSSSPFPPLLNRLSATRKKRKPAEGYATPADLKTYTQSATVPSMHGTKPPGISALDLAKDGEVLVTGG